MRSTLLDFSRQRDLAFHAEVVADVQAAASDLGITPLIVGAFARDLHMFYAHRIEVERQTKDLDFALAVDTWDTYEELRKRLIDTRKFEPTNAAHRVRHRRMVVDLVPFGNVETRDRKLRWPQDDTVMDTFGFQEAAANAISVLLPRNVEVNTVSLPALALLKFVCWQDRHRRSPGKDAADLRLIATRYLEAGNEPRLWDEFIDWTQVDDFDYESAGPRMLGLDMRALLPGRARTRLVALLTEQTDQEGPGTLPNEMNRQDPDRARAVLASVLHGFEGR